MSDLDGLRQIGASAVRVVERQRTLTSALEELQLAQRRRLQTLNAAFIIETIPIVAELAALDGRNCVSIMRVDRGGYSRPAGNREFGTCKPQWLTGACKIVFAHCKSAGYWPILKYQIDHHVNPWFEIWIGW